LCLPPSLLIFHGFERHVRDRAAERRVARGTRTPAIRLHRVRHADARGHGDRISGRTAHRRGPGQCGADRRENPARTTQLLRTRSGLRYTFDRTGLASIEATTLPTGCQPLILVDGFPPDPFAPKVPGEAVLDWIMHPDEIGGVEIYNVSGAGSG
jgi:hypothetical protein